MTFAQVGQPYGVPVEFWHPDEYGVGNMGFTFLRGTKPAGLDAASHLYAWAALQDDTGAILAQDFAPNDGWMAIVP